MSQQQAGASVQGRTCQGRRRVLFNRRVVPCGPSVAQLVLFPGHVEKNDVAWVNMILAA